MKRTTFRKLSLTAIASAMLFAGGCVHRYQVDTEAPNYAAVAESYQKAQDVARQGTR